MTVETTTSLLPVTPSQIEGPYFRLGTPRRESLIEPGITGDPLVLSGQVKTTQGKPVPDAIVHFWLSDDEGNYDMVGHKLQGYTVTDSNGRYRMEMIVPACYEPRQAKHIHVKVQGVSRPLTTQLFFSDDEGRLRDNWYNPDLEIKMEEGGDGKKHGAFDFVIEQVREGKDNVTAETFAARVEALVPYDLLIKGGHVLDPGQNLDGPLDIGISDGKIAAIQADIPTQEATRTVRVHGADRYVVPGLIDIHTHVAYGAQTPGVGMLCVDPDVGGVHSGATTVVDAGSVGVANVGVFKFHILPRAKTRVLVLLNIGSFAHTMPGAADVGRLEEIDRKAIAGCIQANPGLISGFKLRMVGPVVKEQGEAVIRLASEISREHNLPLMVHIGDGQGDPQRHSELTRLLLNTFRPGDILTHLCTPNPGGVMIPDDAAQHALPEVREARARGVVLDPALGRGNFGIQVARRQAEMGLQPDTLSSDVTLGGRTRGVGLLDSMSKFLSLGYSLPDVVRMASSGAAQAIGRQDEIGALAVGRAADVTIFDVVNGKWRFTDTKEVPFTGERALVPVQTVRAGELFSPDWGPYPWGWLPEEG